VPQIHGRRAVDSLRILSPDPNIDLEVESAWLEGIEAADTEGVVEIPGAMAFVASLPKSYWSIVTSGTSPVAIARMNAVGLSPLHAVYGEDVENGKPAPDPYLMAAQRLQLDPSDCLVFEDTVAGVRSGKAAGMKVVAVTAGNDRPEVYIADRVISDYLSVHVTQNLDGIRVDFDSET
jgi:sugar-phosphatase